MTTVMPSLQAAPLSSGIKFTAPSAIRTPPAKHSVERRPATSSGTELSIIEVESQLRDAVQSRYLDIQQGFQNYDINQLLSVSPEEFRRVLETHCLSLTNSQFKAILNKVDTNPNGTVRYCDFLDKFGGVGVAKSAQLGRANNRVKPITPGARELTRVPTPKQLNTDMIEKMIKQKLQKDVRNTLKTLRLHDYNRDGHIQKQDLRRVLETTCFTMSDTQFDKLYQRYDFHHKGALDYKEFLTKLGINVTGQNSNNNNASYTPPQTAPIKPGPVFTPVHTAQGLNIFQVEAEFRKKMKENFVNVKKMCMAFDGRLDGLVHITDLKSILNNFVLTMSDQTFNQLMDRLQIKATHKISWEMFLQKFQDSLAHANGQTLPIKPAHKFFPIRGSSEKMDFDDLVRLVVTHVHNAYSSFKHAFLQMDKTRSGKITRRELRKLIEKYNIRLSAGQWKELMVLLDPDNTQHIDYHAFLTLFEQTESLDAHPWLESCHRYNDKQKPLVLAWDTVEDLLREKCTVHWRDLMAAIAELDKGKSGYTSRAKLRRLLHTHAMPISDQHYLTLVERLKEHDAGNKVNYSEFFSRLGVKVGAGDKEGVSTRITNDSQQAADRMMEDQLNRQVDMARSTVDRTGGMTVDEILCRIKDRLSQHSTQFREAFHSYDKNRRGKISKKVFRQVLASMGLTLSDDQFSALCDRLKFYKGCMNYRYFVSNFEDARNGGPGDVLIRGTNHHVNQHRGDDVEVTADMAIRQLEEKIRLNFETLNEAFHKFSDNGVLTKKKFRQILNFFRIPISAVEFEKFCEIMGLDSQSRISYHNFLAVFEARDTEDGHPWLNSVHRYNEVRPMKLMEADKVHQILSEKAHRQYPDLAKAVRAMDTCCSGKLSRRSLREMLYRFMLPISKAEFKKLWARFDPGARGVISHADFLQQLAGEKFTPADDQGPSVQISDGNEASLGLREMMLEEAHEDQALNQALHVRKMRPTQLLIILRDKIRDSYPDFTTAFNKFDVNHQGHLTVTDLHNALVKQHFLLTDQQFDQLLQMLCLKESTRISYKDFLSLFEEGRKDWYPPKPEDALYPVEENGHLSDNAAISKMMKSIADNSALLISAFQSFDQAGSGQIGPGELRRILDNFCFKLTGGQYKALLSQLTTDQGQVDYRELLDRVGAAQPPEVLVLSDAQNNNNNAIDTSPEDEDTLGQLPTFSASFRGRTSCDMRPMTSMSCRDLRSSLSSATPRPFTPLVNAEDTEKKLGSKIRGRWKEIQTQCRLCDPHNTGVISQDQITDILDSRLRLQLSADQLRTLLLKYDLNNNNTFCYPQFIRHIVIGAKQENVVPQSARAPRRKQEQRPEAGGQSPVSGPGERLRRAVVNNWKEMRREFRRIDSNAIGVVSYDELRQVLRGLSSNVSEAEFEEVLATHDPHNTRMINYNNFISSFLTA